MRIFSPFRVYRRPRPLSPPTAHAADLAQAVRLMIENQNAILNDLAQIKAALPSLAAAPFEAAYCMAPTPGASSMILSTAVNLTNQIAAFLSD